MKLRLTYDNGYTLEVPLRYQEQADRFIDGSFHSRNCAIDGDCPECPFRYNNGRTEFGCRCIPYFVSAEIVYEKMNQHKLGRFYD